MSYLGVSEIMEKPMRTTIWNEIHVDVKYHHFRKLSRAPFVNLLSLMDFPVTFLVWYNPMGHVSTYFSLQTTPQPKRWLVYNSSRVFQLLLRNYEFNWMTKKNPKKAFQTQSISIKKLVELSEPPVGDLVEYSFPSRWISSSHHSAPSLSQPVLPPVLPLPWQTPEASLASASYQLGRGIPDGFFENHGRFQYPKQKCLGYQTLMEV